MKKALSLLLTAFLLFSCAQALAESSYCETPLGSSSENKRHNISLVCEALDGWVLLSGETFSFNDSVGPRDADHGYLAAENGRGARVRGGGAAQAATTLYLAVRELPGVTIDEMRAYGAKFSDGYVADGADAVLVDYAAGTDFIFTNHGDTLTIRLWTDGDSLNCSAYTGSSGPVSDRMLGFSQTWAGLSGSRRDNIALAAMVIDGTVIEPGEEFSFNDTVGPRTADRGYANAVNGRGVRVRGGGVAQAASAIYLAVKDISGVTVTEKRTYGDRYNQTYVADPDDAIVTDYAAGTDFALRNDSGSPIRIDMRIDEYGYLCCDVITLGSALVWEDEWFFDEEDFLFGDEDGQWVLGDNGEWVWESAWEWLE